MARSDHHTAQATVAIDVAPDVTLFIDDDDCLWIREMQGSRIIAEVRIGKADILLFGYVRNGLDRLLKHAVS